MVFRKIEYIIEGNGPLKGEMKRMASGNSDGVMLEMLDLRDGHRGLEVGAGSDSPITSLDPMYGLWALERVLQNLIANALKFRTTWWTSLRPKAASLPGSTRARRGSR